MTRRLVAIAVCSGLLSIAGGTFAHHEAATVMLRSGERITGEFQDYHRPTQTVYVRTGLHTDRRVPIDEVALVDFVGAARGLPETELRVAREAEHLLLMRDGTSHQGRLIEMGPEDPAADQPQMLVVFRTRAGEELRVNTHDVGRLYLGRFPEEAAPVPTTGEVPPAPEGTVRVPANTQWTPTGIMVREGEPILFNVTGQIRLDGTEVAGAAGSMERRLAPQGAPLPDELAGALIARIGTGEPFAIGNQRSVTMPGTGQLFLGINDDTLERNTGHFDVEVTQRPDLRRR